MKAIILITLTFLTNTAYSQNFMTKLDLYESDFNNHDLIVDEQDVHTEYPIEFKLVSYRPVCPSIDNGPRCAAYGSIVKIKAQLKGCLDKLAYIQTKSYLYDNKLYIEVDARGLSNPRSANVRCIKMPEVFEKVYVPYEVFDEVIIENINSEQ